MIRLTSVLAMVSVLALAQSSQRRDTIPGRYIVQFRDSPQVADQEKAVQREIESHRGRVVETLSTVMKGLIVEADEKTSARVKKMPGVTLVKADRNIKLKPPPKKTETQ